MTTWYLAIDFGSARTWPAEVRIFHCSGRDLGASVAAASGLSDLIESTSLFLDAPASAPGLSDWEACPTGRPSVRSKNRASARRTTLTNSIERSVASVRSRNFVSQ